MATRLGLYPANQASTNSLVVPVLPARSLRPSRGARAGADACHVLHHVVHHKRIARVDDAQRLVAGALGLRERERLPRSSTILWMK